MHAYHNSISIVSQLLEGEGEIKSPNYPEKYPSEWDEVNTGYIPTLFTTVNLTYCQAWNIEVGSRQRIMLKFQSFELADIRDSRDCDDFVQIIFGSVAEKYCGSKLPSPIISSENTMTVVFHSSRWLNHPGFKATWKPVEASGMAYGSTSGKCGDGGMI